MFGKGRAPMSSTARYVMERGRAAGNIKSPTKYIMPPADSANRKGRGSAKKTAPVASDAKHATSTPKRSAKSYGRLGTV